MDQKAYFSYNFYTNLANAAHQTMSQNGMILEQLNKLAEEKDREITDEQLKEFKSSEMNLAINGALYSLF